MSLKKNRIWRRFFAVVLCLAALQVYGQQRSWIDYGGGTASSAYIGSKTITTFGRDGAVNLRDGFERDPAKISQVQSNSPGKVFQNLVILGSAPGEGYVSPPGDLRAYDVFTGKLVWTFHTIPHPGEFGYETNPKDG